MIFLVQRKKQFIKKMKVLKSLFKKNRNKQKRKLSNWIMVKAKETKLKKRTKVAVDHCLLFLFLDF
jgi:hypothetical protein